MKIKEFSVLNFKGIKNTDIEISTTAPGNVVMLIGLNESGKTTILEAISHFVSADVDTSSIMKTQSDEVSLSSLIPKSKESNFTGEIKVSAVIEVEQIDLAELNRYMNNSHGIEIVDGSLDKTIRATLTYSFKDSKFESKNTLWWLGFDYKKKNSKKLFSATAKGADRNVWVTVVRFLQQRFPKIVYFPTFLFKIPDRIYLEERPDWSKNDEASTINRYFKQVIQDIADSLNEEISIDQHIVARVRAHREASPTPESFLSLYSQTPEHRYVRAVTRKLSTQVTKVVFGAWTEISDRSVAGKQIRIECEVDPEAGNIPYLTIMISDGRDEFRIHERSLGFRWFFTFLLFTQFRKNRHSELGTIFLFDEPASNLHARAQMRLLESFGRTVSQNQYIVYSTHSHYMINPMWLEKAYIVQNSALEEADDDPFADYETDIKLTRYRSFVATNPTRTSYFQPALDAIKYSFGPLMPGQNAVVVEGKYDFHPLRYFQERGGLSDFLIIPAPSATECGTLISLLRGLGSNFLVMLDDDAEGRRAAARYRKDHLLEENQAFTLGALDNKCQGQSFEGLYGPEILSLLGVKQITKDEKGRCSLLFQEFLLNKNFDVDLGETDRRASSIIKSLRSRLGLPDIKEAGPKRSKPRVR